MLRNEKGNAMIYVIIIFVVIAALTPAFVVATNAEIKYATTYQSRTQAYYYARSGVENALDWLIDGYKLNELYDGEVYMSGSVETLTMSEIEPVTVSEITVSIKTIIGSDEIEIISRGIYNGVSEELTLIVNTVMIDGNAYIVSDFDKAIFITDNVDLQSLIMNGNGQSNLVGDIGIMVDYNDLDIIGFDYDAKYWDSSNKIYLYLPAGSDEAELVTKLEALKDNKGNYTGIASFYYAGVTVVVEDKVISYPEPWFPVFPANTSVTDRTDAEINFTNPTDEIRFDSLTGSLTVYLDPDGDNIIYVNDLNLDSIVINNAYDWETPDENSEPYKLNIYVYDTYNVNGNETINEDGGIGDLLVYYKGTDEMRITGTIKINGSVFLETADYYAGGNVGFLGHIIMGSGDATITGNTTNYSRVLYAPSSYVELTGSETFNGSIIGKDVKCWGSGSVKYDDETIDLATFPWEIFDDPGGGSGGYESQYKRVLGYYWQ